jgi:hypothetical protein
LPPSFYAVSGELFAADRAGAAGKIGGMASALITLEILLLLYVPFSGWQAAHLPFGAAEFGGVVAHHILVAFPAFILAAFAHAMTMFYFIGTGKTVKEARKSSPAVVTEHDVAETIRFKRITSPLLTLALALIIAAPVSGGPLLVLVKNGPGGWLWLHILCVSAALAVQLYTAVITIKIVAENVRLLQDIDSRFPDGEPGRPAAH